MPYVEFKNRNIFMAKKIAVLGAGSWGTAVAIHLALGGHEVTLWGRDEGQIEAINKTCFNDKYLPKIKLPSNLKATYLLNEATTSADYVIIGVPSHAFADILAKIDKPTNGLVWITKGIDPKTNQFLSDIVQNSYGSNYPMAMLSGPSFAKEVATKLPTALTLASNSPGLQKNIRQLLHFANMRVYCSDDLQGVQICGAVKNVLAIACGISDGLNFGANAKAALITRGLAEMTRLGDKLGAKPETFIGLAGLGDLVLTCTDDQSRNRRFGLLIGRGYNFADALKEIGQVVEGQQNATQVHAFSKKQQVDMPICEAVYKIMQGKFTAKEAVESLMNRPPK